MQAKNKLNTNNNLSENIEKINLEIIKCKNDIKEINNSMKKLDEYIIKEKMRKIMTKRKYKDNN